jgi:hypothetical protein
MNGKLKYQVETKALVVLDALLFIEEKQKSSAVKGAY